MEDENSWRQTEGESPVDYGSQSEKIFSRQKEATLFAKSVPERKYVG